MAHRERKELAMSAVRVLMDSIVDYAGLFPPAKLEMCLAVDNYARYRASDESWILARFITTVARLNEFEKCGEKYWAGDGEAEPWYISALPGANLDADIDRIFAFNQKYAPDFSPLAMHEHVDDGAEGAMSPVTVTGGAVIDTIELKAATGHDVDRALKIIPEQIEPFFEIDWRGDTRGIISALAGTGARAKIRTGGVTEDLIPPAEAVAEFVANCAAADVAFKATAGLHHPVRAEYPLTYEAGCARGTMHGFLNVFMASAFIRTGAMDAEGSERVLSETDASAFQLGETHASWRGKAIEIARLASVRERFAISFAFPRQDEPVADLRSLGMM